MKQGNKIFSPSVGMNRDTHPSTLKKEQYTFAKNISFEEATGDGFLLQNEPSNIKCIDFPIKDGKSYNVVGVEYNQYDNYTLFFLSHPSGYSMIGKVENNWVDDNKVELSGDDVVSLDVSDSLCEFTPIMSDECSKEPTFNFSLDYPFKKGNIVVKKEKCGTVVYFTDFYNPPRYINLYDLEKYKYKYEDSCTEEKELVCQDCKQDDYIKCPNVDIMRIFPLYKEGVLKIEEIVYGGRLKQGSYEILSAYCDEKGNEVSGYFGKVPPVKLFDSENILQIREDFNKNTGYGLKLSISGLDKRFKYYKIAIIYRGVLSGHESGSPIEIYSEGVHPTTDKSVMISSLVNASHLTIGDISIPPVVYEKTEMLATGNGYLFHGGLVPMRDINLQPIFNLMGAFLEWRTIKVNENFYKDASNISNFGSYLRDEIYPFGVSVKMEGGFSSRKFVLPNRPPNEYDLEVFNNKSSESVSQTDKCTGERREKRWEFMSTATNDGYYYEGSEDTEDIETVTKQKKKRCTTEPKRIEDIVINLSDNVDLNGETLGDYLKSNIEDIVSGDNIYSNDFAEVTSYYADLGSFGDCDIMIDSNCQNSQLIDEIPFLKEVGGETETHDDKPNDLYINNIHKTQTYFEEKRGSLSIKKEYDRDVTLEKHVKDTYDVKMVIYKRTPSKDNRDYTNATTLKLSEKNDYYAKDEEVYAPTIFAVEDVDDDGLFTELMSKDVSGVDTPITASSFWYKYKVTEDIKFFEIEKIPPYTGKEDAFIQKDIKYRVSFYSKVGESLTYVDSKVISPMDGLLYEANKDSFANNEVYIVIDFPILTGKYLPARDCYFSATPWSGLKLKLRGNEYINRRITISYIELAKKQTYELDCEYVVSNNSCDFNYHEHGDMGYYESSKKYPCNKELFNSSELIVKEENIPASIKDKFESYFVESKSGGLYKLNNNADLRNKGIRLFRFPDNTVSPFMDNINLLPFTENNIFPIGVYVEEEVINFFLDLAVSNDLISQEERDKIYEVEFYRGDRSIHKSIVAKGLLYDMYKYQDNGTECLYSNYPYNDLGDDTLNCVDSSRKKHIEHPFGGLKNNQFTFHSADTHFNQPKIGKELMVEGYLSGDSRGRFAPVEGHPSWVVMGSKAYKNSDWIAIGESVVNLALNVSNMIIRGAETGRVFAIGGMAFGVSQNLVGAGLVGGAISAYTLAQAGKLAIENGARSYKWQEIFYNNGKPRNFASYYSSEGFYNTFTPEYNEDNKLRKVDKSKYLKGGTYSMMNKGRTTFINNRNRESSLYLSLNDFIEYSDDYIEKDNGVSNKGSNSRFKCSDLSCECGIEETRNIASPYVSIKNWRNDLFGDVYDVNWVRIGQIRSDSVENEEVLFGGDTFISRLSLKRKVPFFYVNAMDLSMDIPFAYSEYSNIGYVSHYMDFNTGIKKGIAGALYPRVGVCSYDYADCLSGGGDTYVRNPSKIYLWYYGIPQFLVESEINCNYRHIGSRKEQSFYPHCGDYMDWTQEMNISIKEDNFFLYNSVYSQNHTYFGNNMLPVDYSKDSYDCFHREPNGVIYSLQDNSEKTYYDSNLYYRPLDKYEFKWTGGKLIDLLGVQSSQVFARFENHVTLFNAVDELRDRLADKVDVGNKGSGGIFSGRRKDSIITDLGFGGTQHKESVSCEYGIFFVDARRGQVFQMNLGGGVELQEITTGVRHWFKEHLPFKILRGNVEGLTDLDLDNKFKGLGISMGWDSKFKRVFLTKKDYIIKENYVGKLKFENNKFLDIETDTEVYFENKDIFKDVSFTIAYSPITKYWISYYDFKPNYYVNYHNFFRTGINTQEHSSLWGHLLTNKSYGVFYGKEYPWVFESVLIEESSTEVLKSVSYWLDSKRYHSYYDESENRRIGMTSAYIYNNSMNSGRLDLVVREHNNLYQELQYPKWNLSNMEVLVTEEDKKWNLNTFYNRVRDEFKNTSVWFLDDNNIEKELNREAFVTTETWQDRLRGDWFYVRLESKGNKDYKQIFKWGTAKVQHYF